jgi:hypothetical protein
VQLVEQLERRARGQRVDVERAELIERRSLLVA